MSKTKIISLDITIPITDFNTVAKREIEDYNDMYGTDISYNVSSASTKMGKKVTKIDIVDNNNNNKIEVVANTEPSGDIHFYTIRLSNMSHGFYNITGDENDVVSSFVNILRACATLKQGTIAYIDDDNNCYVINNGNEKHDCSIGIIDKNGQVYSLNNTKTSSFDEDDTNFHFSIKTPIKDWLSDHVDLKKMLMGKNLNQQMDIIGKWLIQARCNDEIDSSEFMDIFCQAGILGFSDQSVLNIYKLLM